MSRVTECRRRWLRGCDTVWLAGFLAVIYPDMHMFTQTVAPVYWVFFGLLLPLATIPNHEGTEPAV